VAEFDFERKVWNMPAERMKMRRPHLVPLSSQAIDLLNQLKPMTGAGTLLFPGRNNPKKPMSDMALTVLVRRIGYAGSALQGMDSATR
jgi:integrase